MIVGIGTDITSVSRIENIWMRMGEPFARRILTEYEFSVFTQRNFSVTYLASRFAAKEAVSKALGTGIGKVSFQHIEIRNDDAGAPVLILGGYAKELEEQKGVRSLHVSLSDEKEFAQAFVVLES